MKYIIIRFFFGILFVLVFLSACGEQPTVEQATSKLLLADVTSAGSGKYGKTTESYWYDPAHAEYIIRCFHDNDWETLTADPTNCEHFTIPPQIPHGATFLAINMGSGQSTQSVWLLPNQTMIICNHDSTFWGNTSASVMSCAPFVKPKEVNPSDILVSLNSGQNVKAQSFWTDGHVCVHEKIGGGFFSNEGFGPSQGCTQFSMDMSILPSAIHNPKLEAVTSDANQPPQTFWQGDNGVLVRCKHNRSNDGWFSSETIGSVDHCDYWRAPTDF